MELKKHRKSTYNGCKAALSHAGVSATPESHFISVHSCRGCFQLCSPWASLSSCWANLSHNWCLLPPCAVWRSCPKLQYRTCYVYTVFQLWKTIFKPVYEKENVKIIDLGRSIHDFDVQESPLLIHFLARDCMLPPFWEAIKKLDRFFSFTNGENQENGLNPLKYMFPVNL